MPRLVEGLTRFFGRVEIFALGLESERQAAEAALLRGQPLEARDHAREILAQLPDSPLGLALWADAAEEAWLDHEVVTALSELAKRVPWRADVWLRLGRAGLRTEWPGAREALERAATAPDERESARLALLDLADLDLAAGDPERAQRWLDRVPPLLTGVDREVALRRAECALVHGDLASAAHEIEKAGGDDAADGRSALVRARLALGRADVHEAMDLALRALVLETPGADDLVATLVAASRDVVVVDRVRRVVTAAQRMDEPTWAAAFAFAEGRRDDARRALARGLGSPSAAAALLAMATETRDLDALHALHARDPALLPPMLRTLRKAAVLGEAGKGREALDLLDAVSGEVAGWAAELRLTIVSRWLPPLTPAAASLGAQTIGEAPPALTADWGEILHQLRRVARGLDRLDLAGSIEALVIERERPLRVAVVGEFNAGKSTFLNALLGEDVAPTGVLPTTATLHWVAWAPDPFARIMVRGAPDRVVPHDELKATLGELAAAHARVDRVFIYAPLERLKRVEVLDTPGFNAPDPDHLAAARQAFEEAHVAIWLLDATHALKETERKVLAEIQGLGVPVQILANKADRLKPDELGIVLEHIREGLDAVGLRSHAPPVAFSARLSLKGRLGDAAALAASGWPQIEALISEQIVDQSDALKERALRRRAGRLAAELTVLARARASDDREAIRLARERTEQLRSFAARLRREKQAIAAAADKAIEPTRRLLQADLRPLGEIPEERQRGDAGLREYLSERFVSRLADPVIAELTRAAAGAPPTGPLGGVSGSVLLPWAPPRAAAAVRAVLMGAAASQDTPAALIERPLDRVLEAAVDAFASALLVEAEQPLQESPFSALELRAEALQEALPQPAALAEGATAAPPA
jgi:GTP-binding protein EngB required for normal cell division/tetratricopeptide (TPR) repeat protein